MKKIGLVSLGCCKNLYDSELILGLIKDHYEIVNDPKEADIIIINTCAFIKDAKKESIATIFEMKKYGAKLVVVGCLAERYKLELIKSMPEVDLFISIKEYPHFLELLSNLDKKNSYCGGLDYRKRVLSGASFSAYLRIGDGCDNKCSYCAIPLIRGEYHSREMNEIIDEANRLKEIGVKELVVIAQDTTKYGVDLNNNENIVSLLKELLKIKEFVFIRLLYLYPDEISDELIDLIAKEERLTPYFDIPIQHSESHILEAMNRRGDKEYLLSLFNKIKTKVPNAVLRTTVMIGFPYESDEDISNLIDFMKEVKFDHLGAFTYSKEEDTPAYNYPQIKENIKKARFNKVVKVQEEISYNNNQKHIGEIMKGIVIDTFDNGYLVRSYWNAPDNVDGNIYLFTLEELNIGELVYIKIVNADIHDLDAELVNKL